MVPSPAARVSISLSNVPLCGQTTFYLRAHQQTCCFHFLTTMSTTATSIRRQVFMQTYVILSLGYILREVEGLGHIVQGILETARLHSHTRGRWERFTISPPPFYHPETISLCFSFHSLMAQLLVLSSTLTLYTYNSPRFTMGERLRATWNFQRPHTPTSRFQTGLKYSHLILRKSPKKETTQLPLGAQDPKYLQITNRKSLTPNHTYTI